MSVWGKVSGAAAGLFVAGPVGALVGAVAGHFFLDRDSDPGGFSDGFASAGGFA